MFWLQTLWTLLVFGPKIKTLYWSKETTQVEVWPIMSLSSVVPWSQSCLSSIHQLIKGGQRQLTAWLIPLRGSFKRWAIRATSATPPPPFSSGHFKTHLCWSHDTSDPINAIDRFFAQKSLSFASLNSLLFCCRGLKSSAGSVQVPMQLVDSNDSWRHFLLKIFHLILQQHAGCTPTKTNHFSVTLRCFSTFVLGNVAVLAHTHPRTHTHRHTHTNVSLVFGLCCCFSTSLFSYWWSPLQCKLI